MAKTFIKHVLSTVCSLYNHHIFTEGRKGAHPTRNSVLFISPKSFQRLRFSLMTSDIQSLQHMVNV